MTLVVDSSVAIKWYLTEPYHAEALQLLRSGERMIAPDLLTAEVTNILWKRVRRRELDEPEAVQILEDFRRGDLNLVPMSDLAQAALQISIELGHPVYDCLFLACAQARGLGLVTADLRLLRALAGSRYAHLAVHIGET